MVIAAIRLIGYCARRYVNAIQFLGIYYQLSPCGTQMLVESLIAACNLNCEAVMPDRMVWLDFDLNSAVAFRSIQHNY